MREPTLMDTLEVNALQDVTTQAARPATARRRDYRGWRSIRVQLCTHHRLQKLAALWEGYAKQQGRTKRFGRKRYMPLGEVIEQLIDRYDGLIRDVQPGGR